MPFAVECSLDENAAESIRQLWQRLLTAGVASSQLEPGIRPHITLAVFSEVDPDTFGPLLAAFAADQSPLPITFSSLGCFPAPSPVVFLAPVVTGPLLRLHWQLHQRVESLVAAAGAWEYYRPGRWVPHTTLAMDMPASSIPAAMAVCQTTPLPIVGQLERIGLVEFRPAVHLYDYPLGGARSFTAA